MRSDLVLRSCLMLFLALDAAAAPRPDAPVKMPDTPAGRHAAAWLEAFNAGDEAANLKVLREHFAARALASAPPEARMERLRGLRSQAGSLTPVRVVEADQSFVRLVARDARGLLLQLDFECEEQAPFGLVGIRLLPAQSAESVEGRAPPLGAAELPARFDEYLSEKAKAGEFWGAVLVAKDGNPVLRKAYGVAELRFDSPARPDTRFNFGSIGKLLTRTAIAQLVAAGKLRLDDRLSRWLPDWPKESGEKITIEQLVEHRAGVTDFFNERYEQMDRSTLRHNRDYVALFRDAPLWFEPGTSERYSNGGYVLLGEIVARASGMDYYDYLHKHVLEPAGMNATDWFEADAPTPNLAMGYIRGGDGKGALRENVFTRPARGSAAGGGYSTVDDLLRFELALRGGALVSSAWSRWVLGGPRPDSTSGGGPLPGGYAFLGGAPGISARLAREGPWTLVVLSNLDRSIVGPVEERLQGWVQSLRE